MPVVAVSELPSFRRLREQGSIVLSTQQAARQDIREQHIGILNMMPDTALQSTEQQFLRLIGQSNEVIHFHPHLFTLDSLPRSPTARKHIDQYYETFEHVCEVGLDGLIISGANVTHPDLTDEPFWDKLAIVIEWAWKHVTSTLCSCLASHAVMDIVHGQKRTILPDKCWGVFPHHVVDRKHPLMQGVNTHFDVPHSRHNQITAEQFKQAQFHVLVESEQAGVHLAVSQDGFRQVLFQGHPEYDTISLLKEYKREVQRYFTAEREDYPPFPHNYLDTLSRAVLTEYRDRVKEGKNSAGPLPRFPEHILKDHLRNSWQDSAKSIFSNWSGLVYQFTHVDRKKAFMDHIDRNRPLWALQYEI